MKKTYEDRWGHSRSPKKVQGSARKAKRREEAESRNLAYRFLSKSEKIERAKNRPGNSTRELKKLGAI